MSKTKAIKSLQEKRHPQAIALDKWLETEAGKGALESSILRRPENRQYLENRVKGAFAAGWDAARLLLASANERIVELEHTLTDKEVSIKFHYEQLVKAGDRIRELEERLLR